MGPAGVSLQRPPTIPELCHRINSPLAAVRNALYLAGCRSQDPTLLQYLQLADGEVSVIADILRQAGALQEEQLLHPDERLLRRVLLLELPPV